MRLQFGFLQRGNKEVVLTNLHHGGRCRSSYYRQTLWIWQLWFKKCKLICRHLRVFFYLIHFKLRPIGSKHYFENNSLCSLEVLTNNDKWNLNWEGGWPASQFVFLTIFFISNFHLDSDKDWRKNCLKNTI